MTAPHAPVHATPTPAPWGHWRPNALERILIGVCRRLPKNWWGRRLRILLRRPVKYGGPTPLDVEVWGLRLRLYRKGNFSETELITCPDVFDPVERDTLRRFLRPGAVFLDIGANAGAYSFWVHSILAGNCTIATVEPDPELHARIAFNVSQNHCLGVHTYNVAIGGSPERATLTINPAVRGQNSLLGVAGTSGLPTVEVEVWTVEQLVRSLGSDRIDAMKMDIEGMESAALVPFFAATAPSLWPRLLILESKLDAESVALRARIERLGYRPLQRAGLNVIFERDFNAPSTSGTA